MKDVPRFAASLTLVALLAAGSLAWINEITKPKIAAQQENTLKNALISVLPGIENGCIVPVKENDEILYYKGYQDKDTTLFIGYAVCVFSKGYASTIQTLVSLDSAGTILSIKILSQQETPGLGTRCEEVRAEESVPWWQAQFSGKKAINIAVDKDGGSIESITGATITSRAITDSIADRARWLFEKIGSSSHND